MPKTLSRNLSLVPALAVAISMIVGSGLFALPGLAIDASDPITALLAWFTVALCVAPLIHVFAKLGQLLPQVDGVAGFAAHGLGGWSLGGFNLIACGALATGMPAFFFVAASYLCDLLALDHSFWQVPMALLVTWLTTFLNLSGLQNIALINRGTVLMVILMMVIMIVISWSNIYTHPEPLTNALMNYSFNTRSLWASSVIIFWAFQGWENLTFGLEEVEDPQKNIPLIFWLSFIFIVILYLIFATMVSLSVLTGYSVSGISGLNSLLGHGLIKTALLVFIVLILIANANAWVFGASRAYYAAARNGMLPKMMTITNRQNIPNCSLAIAAIFYSTVIMAIDHLNLPISTAFMITSQGFIILYGFSIGAYLREFGHKPHAWVISCLALAGWLFLIHEFNLLLLYPLVLFLIGTLRTRNQKQCLI